MRNKTKIGKTVSMGQLLEFEIIFPDEEKLTIEEYLFGGSREIILNSAVFFLGFKNNGSKFSDNKEFLGMLFGEENNLLANQIYEKIKNHEQQQKKQIGIINTYSSLKLFESYFSKPSEPETQTHAEFEINLFKAYLVLNSEYTSTQLQVFESTKELEDILHFPMVMFCMNYPVSDKSNYDISQIWGTQIIKAIYLFQFLESHDKTQPLISALLDHFNCRTWQDYLKRLLPLTFPAIGEDREAHTDIVVQKGDGFEEGVAFIEKLIVQKQDDLDLNDFLALRAKPFYKVENGVYRIIFNLFVVEKIFKGMYFTLRDINSSLPSHQKIKDIRSFYGDEFCEKILCYKVMESIYERRNCIRFSGKQLSDLKIDGAPDYYVRNGKNIVLIESKDFLISADNKMSFDFNVYEQEFGRILDYEELPTGKIRQKAVVQLVNSIRRVLKKEFNVDSDYHYREVKIYPVLLTHDLQYDVNGFNELINYWFQDELLKLEEEGLFIQNVCDLSVVNIDSIIYNQVGLSDKVPLHEMLRLYHENKKMIRSKRKIKTQDDYDEYLKAFGQTFMDKLIPFSMYIEKYFKENGLWKMPPILDLASSTIFNEEHGNV